MSSNESGVEAQTKARPNIRRAFVVLMDIANNIEGKTICALGDATAWPIQAMIRRFREEFEKRVSPKEARVPASAAA